MSTPVPHLRNFKGNGLDPRQISIHAFWIFNCWFQFSIQHLNFIAEFKNYTLPLEFTSLENSTQLFCLTLLAVHFFNSLCQIIHSQTMQFSTRRTHFYTVSLLLFIRFDDWTITLHLTEIRTLHSIFSTQLLNFCLRFSDDWSRQKQPLWGWQMATDRPPPSVISSIVLCEKRESVGNTRLLPQAKICLITLFKRKALYCG